MRGNVFVPLLLTAVVVVACLLAAAFAAAQGYRDYYVGVHGDNLATDWPTSIVYDPQSELFIIAAQAYAPNAKLWAWDARALTFTHIAFSGATTGAEVLDPNNGMLSNMASTGAEGAYGVALAVNSATGAIFGYLLTLSLVHTVVLVQKAAPNGVTKVSGAWATAGNIPGAYGTSRHNAPLGMCQHLGTRRTFMGGGQQHRLVELTWNAGHTSMTADFIAGDGTAGAIDGTTANTAKLTSCARCDVWLPSSSGLSAVFFTDYGAGRIRRLSPMPTSPSAVFTTSVVTTIFNNLDVIADAAIMCSFFELPGSNNVELYYGWRSGTAARNGIYRFKLDKAWGATTPALVPVAPVQFAVTVANADTIGAYVMPNGTIVTMRGGISPVYWRGLRVWERGTFFGGTITKSRSVTPCTANPSIIDPKLVPPEGAIAPVTDSIFDFRTYQNLCCSDVTKRITWLETCRTTLGTCTAARAGVTLYSAQWLLQGKFDTTANAEAWATSCLLQYLTCMRNGVAATPPQNHPTCGWGAEARTKLNDLAECEVFVSAALTGMQALPLLPKAPEICAGVLTNSTLPPPAPAGTPSSASDIIAAMPAAACAAAFRCPRDYSGSRAGSASPACTCPAETTNTQTVGIYTAEFPLPATSSAVTSKAASFGACRLAQGSLSVCTSKAARANEWISMHVRDVLEFSVNATRYRLGGNCVQKNSVLGTCQCPRNTSAFEYAIPQDDGLGGQVMRILTFCMPYGMATFFEGKTEWQTSAAQPYSKCVHPFGANYSCQCTPYSTQRRVPVSIYENRFVTYATPGEWVFCDSDQKFPDEIDPAIVATTIGITVVGGVLGGSLSVLQAAALMMTMCAENATNSSKGMVVFANIEKAGEAGQFAFMAVFGFAVVGAHLLATILYFLLLLCCAKRPLPDFETGYIDAASLDESPGVYEMWHAAALKTRFPHWSCMFLRVVFPGFTLEAASLLRTESGDAGMYVIGACGLAVSVIWIATTLYFSWWSIGTVAPDVCDEKHRPDMWVPEDGVVDKAKVKPPPGSKYADADGVDKAEKPTPPPAAAAADGERATLVEYEEWDDGDWVTRPNIHTRDVDGNLMAEIDDGKSGGGGDVNESAVSAGGSKKRPPHVRFDPPGGDGKTLAVRLPPYFTWYTEKATLSKFPGCLNVIFTPRGWWSQRRLHNRRFATFYNTYMPRANKWCPTLMQLYMFFISVISITNECEVPMSIVGAVNVVMMLAVSIPLPFRRPMETFFMTLQFAAAAALAFSRSQRWEHNAIFFVIVVFVALSALVHHGIIQGFEMAYTYDDEMRRFHDTDAVREKSLELLREHGKTGTGAQSKKKYEDAGGGAANAEEGDGDEEMKAAVAQAPAPNVVKVRSKSEFTPGN